MCFFAMSISVSSARMLEMGIERDVIQKLIIG